MRCLGVGTRIVAAPGALDLVAPGIGGKRAVVVAPVLERLAQGESQVKLVSGVEPVARGQTLHGPNLVFLEAKCFQVGEAEPCLSQRGNGGDGAAVGGDAVRLPSQGLERVPVAHLQPGVAGGALESPFVLAHVHQYGGGQHRVGQVLRLGCLEDADFLQRSLEPAGLAECVGVVIARLVVIGGKFQAAAQQLYGIIEYFQLQRDVGEQADCVHIRRPSVQIVPADPFGHAELAVRHQAHRLAQPRMRA